MRPRWSRHQTTCAQGARGTNSTRSRPDRSPRKLVERSIFSGEKFHEIGALRVVESCSHETLEPFEQAKAWRADAVLRLAGQGLTGGRKTAALALSHRLPSMLLSRADVEAGGLMSYYIDFNPGWRRLATYVDRILKGARPADLPVVQASRFELVLNLSTAKALNLGIPPTLLARADEVIE